MLTEERILAVLRGEIPDRVPTFVPQILPELRGKIARLRAAAHLPEIPAILKTQNFDFTYHRLLGFESGFCGGDSALLPHYEERQLIIERYPDGRFLDFYGRLMQIRLDKGITNVWYVDGTLKTEEAWRKWPHLKPRPLSSSYFDQWHFLHDRGRDHGFLPIPLVQGLFAKTTEMVTLGRFSHYLRKKPEFIEEILDRILECKLDIIRQYHAHHVPVVAVADDVAFKDNLMIHPDQYERFFVPRHKILTDYIHQCGMLTFLHTDGYITPLIPAIIRSGFDGLQCLENAAGVDIYEVKRQFGQQITLIGNLDVAHLLCFGTPNAVQQEAQKLFQKLKPGGRYIFSPCADLFEDVSYENLCVLNPIFEKEGKYQ
jgi:uroporphyrinogen decarboxylase